MNGRLIRDRYLLGEKAGEGGMAEVWKALDKNTGKTVAVKILKTKYQDDETFVRRFDTEAKAASRMTHPNIVNLLDVGVEEDGTRFLVMEYVSGKTLRVLLRKNGEQKPIRFDIASEIIMRVLAAMAHAHSKGVVHRDIKPQNILVEDSGLIKVADFGIARIADSAPRTAEEEAVMGSVYYFSPEQAQGRQGNEKSDQYSAGVVFYEMLTGHVPFSGKSVEEIAKKHVYETPVPPSELNPAVPEELSRIVLRAMEKRPEDRFKNAEEMLHAVQSVIGKKKGKEEKTEDGENHGSNGKKWHIKWTRRLLLCAFCLVLAGAMALGGIYLMQNIISGENDQIDMPNVIGMEADKARTLLEEEGLQVFLRYEEYNLVSDNLVADQDIAPGSPVYKGESVTLVVCRTQYSLRIPRVTGVSLEDAQNILDNKSLKVGSIVLIPSEAANMMVIEQYPEAGALGNEGDSVELTVSGGMVIMPNLTGKSLNSAEQEIMAFGLIVRDVLEVETEKPEEVGKVILQEPAAYDQILPETAVILTIGAANDMMIEKNVMLDLSAYAAGSSVIVTVGDGEGGESVQYSEVLEEATNEVTVSLYSTTRREAYYTVYVDGETVGSYSITFE